MTTAKIGSPGTPAAESSVKNHVEVGFAAAVGVELDDLFLAALGDVDVHGLLEGKGQAGDLHAPVGGCIGLQVRIGRGSRSSRHKPAWNRGR